MSTNTVNERRTEPAIRKFERGVVLHRCRHCYWPVVVELPDVHRTPSGILLTCPCKCGTTVRVTAYRDVEEST